MHVFKTAFLGQENVHVVLIILINGENLFWHFWIFIYFSRTFFSLAELLFKKNRPSADWAEAQPRGPAAHPESSPTWRRTPAAARVPPGHDAAAALPPPPRSRSRRRSSGFF